jgi:hypothetical protein
MPAPGTRDLTLSTQPSTATVDSRARTETHVRRPVRTAVSARKRRLPFPGPPRMARLEPRDAQSSSRGRMPARSPAMRPTAARTRGSSATVAPAPRKHSGAVASSRWRSPSRAGSPVHAPDGSADGQGCWVADGRRALGVVAPRSQPWRQVPMCIGSRATGVVRRQFPQDQTEIRSTVATTAASAEHASTCRGDWAASGSRRRRLHRQQIDPLTRRSGRHATPPRPLAQDTALAIRPLGPAPRPRTGRIIGRAPVRRNTSSPPRSRPESMPDRQHRAHPSRSRPRSRLRHRPLGQTEHRHRHKGSDAPGQGSTLDAAMPPEARSVVSDLTGCS